MKFHTSKNHLSLYSIDTIVFSIIFRNIPSVEVSLLELWNKSYGTLTWQGDNTRIHDKPLETRSRLTQAGNSQLKIYSPIYSAEYGLDEEV